MKSKRRSKASFAARFKKLKSEESPDDEIFIPTEDDEESVGRYMKSTLNTPKTPATKDSCTPLSITISSPDNSDSKVISGNPTFCIEPSDKVENTVDIIMKDIENNTLRTFTIEGFGLGIEKTIAVVEELKHHFFSKNTEYEQKTSISPGANNQAHLVVILKLVEKNTKT